MTGWPHSRSDSEPALHDHDERRHASAYESSVLRTRWSKGAAGRPTRNVSPGRHHYENNPFSLVRRAVRSRLRGVHIDWYFGIRRSFLGIEAETSSEQQNVCIEYTIDRNSRRSGSNAPALGSEEKCNFRVSYRILPRGAIHQIFPSFRVLRDRFCIGADCRRWNNGGWHLGMYSRSSHMRM